MSLSDIDSENMSSGLTCIGEFPKTGNNKNIVSPICPEAAPVDPFASNLI